MLNPIFEFDYWGLPIYNILVAIGAFFALVTLLNRQKKTNLDVIAQEKVNLSFIVAGFSCLVFANLVNWYLFSEVLNYPLMQRITSAGISFYYGMLGFFLVAMILLRLQKVDYKFWINEVVPSVLIFHAFGRIGCSLAGCCYGIHIGGVVNYFPAREIEALCLFVMFFVFQFAIKKNRFFCYLLSYSIIRFFIEFGRGDDRGRLFINELSPAQVTSILVWTVLLNITIYRLVSKAGANKR